MEKYLSIAELEQARLALIERVTLLSGSVANFYSPAKERDFNAACNALQNVTSAIAHRKG